MPDHTENVGTLLERPLTTTERRRGERLLKLPSLRERKRTENRDRHNQSPGPRYEREFRCECSRLSCQVRLPLEVERHRHPLNRFIVGIAHADTDIVVGVADHFLVVEMHVARTSALRRPADPRAEVSAA